MSNWLNRLVLTTNGRPFTRAEADRIAEYAESLPERLAAARKLEESHKWFARHFSDAIADRAELWGLPREPIVADFTANLAQIAHAMLLDDRGVLDATVVAPGRRLAAALDLEAEDLAELFTTAWGLLSKRLDPAPAALLGPYFVWVSNGLSGEAQSMVETPAPVEV